jgi:hypothetical protein
LFLRFEPVWFTAQLMSGFYHWFKLTSASIGVNLRLTASPPSPTSKTTESPRKRGQIMGHLTIAPKA